MIFRVLAVAIYYKIWSFPAVATIFLGLILIDSSSNQWMAKVMGGFFAWEVLFYIILETIVHLKTKSEYHIDLWKCPITCSYYCDEKLESYVSVPKIKYWQVLQCKGKVKAAGKPRLYGPVCWMGNCNFYHKMCFTSIPIQLSNSPLKIVIVQNIINIPIPFQFPLEFICSCYHSH